MRPATSNTGEVELTAPWAEQPAIASAHTTPIMRRTIAIPTLVYTHLLEIARHHGVPSQLLGYARAQSLGCGRLTVNDINDLRPNRGELQPVENFPLIGVRGEAGDIDNFRGDRDVVAQHLHHRSAVEQRPAASSRGLIAHENNSVVAVGKPSFEMMENAAARRHSRRGDDYHRPQPRVQLDRCRHGFDLGQVLVIEETFFMRDIGADFRTATRDGLFVNLQRGKRHRAVDEGWGARDCASVAQARQMVQDDLGSIDGKRGNNDDTAALERPCNRSFETLKRRRIVMNPIAVGGLDHDHVGGGRRRGRAQDWVRRTSQVAGEEDSFSAGRVYLDTYQGRSDDVPGMQKLRGYWTEIDLGVEIRRRKAIKRIPCVSFGVERE